MSCTLVGSSIPCTNRGADGCRASGENRSVYHNADTFYGCAAYSAGTVREYQNENPRVTLVPMSCVCHLYSPATSTEAAPPRP